MSPSCASSYRVAAFAGKLDAAVLDMVNEELRGLFNMSKARLGEIAAKNPMACARYYDAIVSLFIEVLLNYDWVRARSKEGAGIFGVTKAFYLSTESQNSTGDLHGHMLIGLMACQLQRPNTTSCCNRLHSDFV
ncbi:hypothetical protein PF008_g32382 [Phytophthora fragariae]|uniref:Helitron helicase-like domain-containing protein n=1 Tax=Phytophthora fragariae TaxID=53985 RepID=A0A6G0Q043_9STRA|nr:hypothetical protein PF008_g32382 [Phytophthora fragariae]